NNAGTGVQGLTWMVGDRDEAREVLETNLWSPLALIAALAPRMVERGRGTIVNVGSMARVSPFPHLGHYAASRAALALATEVMRGTFVSAAPAWLVDRFVILGMSHDAIRIFEAGAGGGSVSSFPLPWRQRQMRGWGSAKGFLLVSTGPEEVLTIGRGGAWETGHLPTNSQGGAGEGAFYWDGSFWMSLSWGSSTFAEVDGSRALPLRGRFLEVRNEEIVTYTTDSSERGLDVALHRYGGNEEGIANVSFSREIYRLKEAGTTGSITLLRSGSARQSVEVRVEVIGETAGALPFDIVDPVVRFAPGEIAKDLWVVVPDDQLYQDVETRLRIVRTTAETRVDCAGEAIVRVTDDDYPALFPDLVELTEGDESRVEILRLSIDGGFLRPTLIDFHLDAEWYYGVDRARLGEDFEPLYMTVLVQPGQQMVEVPLVIIGDKRYERTKSIVLRYWYGADHFEADGAMVIVLRDDDLSRRRAVGR
ncbi:MAG: SDR family NAD(P)-dependent oxidoreductase, partial [Acidobacteria bacterium]|nr:SDR family NAD(P)-dependent oxidoreductase [Acidobacteriota bacterium]